MLMVVMMKMQMKMTSKAFFYMCEL